MMLPALLAGEELSGRQLVVEAVVVPFAYGSRCRRLEDGF